MLKELGFRFGPTPDSKPLSFTPGVMTVLVGPSNVGKSRALFELAIRLRGIVSTPDERDNRIINFASAGFRSPPTETDRILDESEKGFTEKRYPKEALELYTGGHGPSEVTYVFFRYQDPSRGDPVGTLLCLSLSGAERLSLVEPQNSESLREQPRTPLSAVFRNRGFRQKLREITYEAFGKYLVVDPIEMKTFRLRLSRIPPVDDEDVELGERGRIFHEQAEPIERASDGVRAYSGLWLSLLSCPWRVAMIDEPELFLHPPLVRRLGLRLAALAAERGASLVTATHSSDFLMGCVESGVGLDIVRLTYKEGIPSAWHLGEAELRPLMYDPLLRSANVLRAVFHEGVVIGEADSDRVFYQEINNRLLAGRGERDGAEDTLFLNAQNKQAVYRMMAPLRRIGIPAAAIVDIDVLKMKRHEWLMLLQAAQVPPGTHEGLSTLKARVLKAFEAVEDGGGADMKDGGVRLLDRQDRESCDDLLANLAGYGIFVVRGGQLESWLSHLNVKESGSKHGSQWLIEVFEKMGSDPSSQDYIKADQGDVWDFMRSIAQWIRNPRRKGVGVE